MNPHLKLLVRGSTTLSQIREKIVRFWISKDRNGMMMVLSLQMCPSDFGTYIEEGKELEKPDPKYFNISL